MTGETVVSGEAVVMGATVQAVVIGGTIAKSQWIIDQDIHTNSCIEIACKLRTTEVG